MNNSKSILIVEDEMIIGALLRKIFESEGFSVVSVVPSGERAVEIAINNNIDIILMDIHLAGSINGIETAKIIKETKDVRIIFITGYPDKETKEKADKTNPVGFFIKPLDIKKLVLHIKKIM